MKLYGLFDAELSRYKALAERILAEPTLAHLHKDAQIVSGRVKQIRRDATTGDDSAVLWGALYLGREGAHLPLTDEKQERKQASSRGGAKGAKKRAKRAAKWQAVARELHRKNPMKAETWIQGRLTEMGYVSPRKKRYKRIRDALDLKSIRRAIEKKPLNPLKTHRKDME